VIDSAGKNVRSAANVRLAASQEANPACFFCLLYQMVIFGRPVRREARLRARSAKYRQSRGPCDGGGGGGFATVTVRTVRTVVRFGLGCGFGEGIGNSGMTLGRPAHPHVVVRPLRILSARTMVASPQSQRQCHRAPPPLLGALASTSRLPNRFPVSSTALRIAPSEHRLGSVCANAPRRIRVIWPLTT
jgi:hypothetical protein